MCSINHDLELIFIHTPKCGGLYIQKVLEKFYNFKTYYFTHENHEKFICIENNNDTNIKNINGFLNINTQGVLRYYMSSTEHNTKMNMDETKWKRYKKFAVLRNPYDRFISAVKYIVEQNNPKTGTTKKDLNITRYVPGLIIPNVNDSYILEIRDASKKYIENVKNINIYDYFHIFINQYDHLVDINEELHVDYFIRFEQLSSDLCDIILKSGVSKIRHRQALLDNIKINNTVDHNFYDYYDNSLIELVNELFDKDFNKFGFNKVTNIEDLLNESKLYYKDIDTFVSDNLNLLIDLDMQNKIIKYDEVLSKNNNNTTDNYNNNDNKHTIDTINITLPDGTVIDINQREQPKPDPKNRITSQFIVEGIINSIKNLKVKNLKTKDIK